MRVIIAGSRDFSDYQLLSDTIHSVKVLANQLEDYACSLPQTSAARSKTLAASNTQQGS